MITSKQINKLGEDYTPRYKVARKYKDNNGKIVTFEYFIRYDKTSLS